MPRRRHVGYRRRPRSADIAASMQAASPFSQWWAQRLYELRARTGRGARIAEAATRRDVERYQDDRNIRVRHDGQERACPTHVFAELRKLGEDIEPIVRQTSLLDSSE